MRTSRFLVALALASCGGGGVTNPLTNPTSGPPAGNPMGHCSVPSAAQPADVTHPDHVVGTGTAASCTGAAFVAAVALGGVITFDCGSDPVTITLDRTAKVVNDAAPTVVIDGAGLVTLSGAGAHRILYMNTCDMAQHWTTSHCNDQDTPSLVVQNLTFVDGSSIGETTDGGGGGAIFDRGGHLRLVNTRFFHNTCDPTGPDLGGGAVRALDQGGGQPVYVVNSTFGGSTELGNSCSNGAGLSSIGVSYTVLNSVFSYNDAIGMGANPMRAGTPGGGSGGAIYNDGNSYTLTICGSVLEHNHANEGGGAIFFVSNDHTGHLVLQDSTFTANPSDGFETDGYPGIFVQAASGDPQVSGTTFM